MKYRKKPVIISAILWTGENFEELSKLGKETKREVIYEESDMSLKIKTLEGIMKADVGDYIIKGVKGELYPCKPDIFEATYERVAK
jgi:hypothetical protein